MYINIIPNNPKVIKALTIKLIKWSLLDKNISLGATSAIIYLKIPYPMPKPQPIPIKLKIKISRYM